MAYGLSKANLRQTSFNVAATLVAAEVAAGFHADTASAREAFYGISLEVFSQLVAELAAESESGQAEERPKASQRPKPKASSTDPRDIVLKYGSFAGLTLGQVLDLSAEEAAEYGYGKSGRDYIKWLASPRQENKFLQTAAKAIIEAEQAGV